MTDYRALLLKYMRHVGNEEGSVFIPWVEDGFTTEEIALLKEIDAEILAEALRDNPLQRQSDTSDNAGHAGDDPVDRRDG